MESGFRIPREEGKPGADRTGMGHLVVQQLVQFSLQPPHRTVCFPLLHLQGAQLLLQALLLLTKNQNQLAGTGPEPLLSGTRTDQCGSAQLLLKLRLPGSEQL